MLKIPYVPMRNNYLLNRIKHGVTEVSKWWPELQNIQVGEGLQHLLKGSGEAVSIIDRAWWKDNRGEKQENKRGKTQCKNNRIKLHYFVVSLMSREKKEENLFPFEVELNTASWIDRQCNQCMKQLWTHHFFSLADKPYKRACYFFLSSRAVCVNSMWWTWNYEETEQAIQEVCASLSQVFDTWGHTQPVRFVLECGSSAHV